MCTILEKLLKKPLEAMGRKLRINDTAAFGLFVTLGTSLTTFEMEQKMDRRGLYSVTDIGQGGADFNVLDWHLSQPSFC